MTTKQSPAGSARAETSHPPNVSLLPRMDMSQHIPFPRPVHSTPTISEQAIEDIDKATLAQIAMALQRTDMGYL